MRRKEERSPKMARLKLVFLSVFLMSVLTACGGGGGVITTTGTVSGQVLNLDAGTPLAGAQVAHSSGSPSTTTDANGNYTLGNVPSGTQTIIASAQGFTSVQREVSVPAQGIATLNFGLTRFGNPAVVGPSDYQGGKATINIISEGRLSVYGVSIAPTENSGGSYTLQAQGLSYLPSPHVAQVPSQTDNLSVRLRELERELARRFPRTFPFSRQIVRPQIGSQQSFWVITSISPLQQGQVIATLQAESPHGLVYVDNQDLGAITQSKASAFLQSWEAEIFPRVTSVFGLPDNPYNPGGQGKVTFLFSRTVGQLGALGYFFSVDLFPDSLTFPQLGLHSNERNMLYVDTSPQWPDNTLKGTMAHEFQHLIHFSQRVFVRQVAPDSTWIDEGLAMVAEDVAGYGYQVGNTTPYAKSFMTNPGGVSLWAWPGTPADYGAAWLFFRYLTDRFGNQVLTKLVQSTQSGATNIETQTGVSIGLLLTSEGVAILNIAYGLGLGMPYTYTSISLTHLGGSPPATTPPGSTTILAGGYRFYSFSKDPRAPAMQVTVQSGTATPWVGAVR